MGLRQICDWCRLLWTYRESLDRELLARRLGEMGLVAEWQAFGAFAVEWLGMPEEAMPFFERGRGGSRKARQICRIVLESGLKRIEQSEAYQNYGIPSMIPFSDLKNAKTFLERFGNHGPDYRK